MDADVFGPSVPRLMHLQGKPYATADKKMIPLENFGVKCISMGFLLDQGEAAVWRGPMVMGAIDKLLKGCEWGELDVLVIDMPPGTGDAYISVSQKIKLSGAVIVSTPQEMSLCGQSHDIFGSGGAERVAESWDWISWAKCPSKRTYAKVAMKASRSSSTSQQRESARAYNAIAKNLMAKLDGKEVDS
eukprot:jgi/Pico_ML_1/51414/g2447.t1